MLGQNPLLNRFSRHLSSFCLGWGWGTPSSLWRWWRFAEWFLAALSYWEINTLLVVWMTAIAEDVHEWRLENQRCTKTVFPPVSAAQSFYDFESDPASAAPQREVLDSTCSTCDVRSSAPRLDPMDPDVFEKWPVPTETRETRYWCNGNECHQIRTYNLLQFATTLRQDWQDEWFLLLWTINPWSLGSLLVFIFVEVHRCPLLSAELSRTRTWRKPHPM